MSMFRRVASSRVGLLVVGVALLTLITSLGASLPAMGQTQRPLALAREQTVTVALYNPKGTLTLRNSDPLVVSAQLGPSQLTIRAKRPGRTIVQVSDGKTRLALNVAVPEPVDAVPLRSRGAYALLAWNDLGMHCMDGDFSIFSLLPPFNNLHAQLVNIWTGKVVTSGVTLTYEATADTRGSINSISSTKTNFWQHVFDLFGAQPAPDVGLAGFPTASFTPAPMQFNSQWGWFEAPGVPITPVDDAMQTNTYPMVKVTARNASGAALATASVVLPVSTEMNCAACHSSTNDSNPARQAARPNDGWVFDPVPEKDWKKNILRRHDDLQLGQPTYQNALAQLGFNSAGLYATTTSGTGARPILCAACHASNALPGTGLSGISALTSAIHTMHGTVVDPTSGMKLDDINNRTACYLCHPGSQTKCLRGAMGSATNPDGTALMNCQSCHAKMSNVGSPSRTGWLEQPNCQACHHDGARDTAAVDSNGVLKTTTDTRFATNPNTPAAGFSLYRFSKGHGNLQCESCHGATHAEYPSLEDNDNQLSIKLQGYAGTVRECTVCHIWAPRTVNGGPHSMHTIGNAWVRSHGSYAEGNHTQCAYCHGQDYRGSPLAQLKIAKTFWVEDHSKTFPAGHEVSCYDCHNGPGGGD